MVTAVVIIPVIRVSCAEVIDVVAFILEGTKKRYSFGMCQSTLHEDAFDSHVLRRGRTLLDEELERCALIVAHERNIDVVVVTRRWGSYNQRPI